MISKKFIWFLQQKLREFSGICYFFVESCCCSVNNQSILNYICSFSCYWRNMIFLIFNLLYKPLMIWLVNVYWISTNSLTKPRTKNIKYFSTSISKRNNSPFPVDFFFYDFLKCTFSGFKLLIGTCTKHNI